MRRALDTPEFWPEELKPLDGSIELKLLEECEEDD
jgi:hypothetical protein